MSEAAQAYPPNEEPEARAETGWRFHTSLTGSWLRPFSTAGGTASAAAAISPAAPGAGQITVVVDPDDSIDFAHRVGTGCRRSGRFVVHTSPKQYVAWRFQTEVLAALGKHWDRPAQGGDAGMAQLVQAWLRAEERPGRAAGACTL